MSYKVGGRWKNESTGLKIRRDAEKVLNHKMLLAALAQSPIPDSSNISWQDLRSLVIRDYNLRKRKSLDTLLYRLSHLDKFFSDVSALDLASRIGDYINIRLKKVSHNTIERELAVVRRAFSLAKKERLVLRVPYIPHLEDQNVRFGFLHHHEYLDLMQALPEYLRGPVCLAYHTGMRQGEIFGLTWDKVDMIEEVIWIDATSSKNRTPRMVPIGKELLKYLMVAGKRKRIGDAPSPVWLNRFGTGRIKDIRFSWKKAVKKIGKPDLLFHDLRRCGVRNLIRAGVPRSIAMAISGHKTESVFERYNIIEGEDIHRAKRMQEEYLKRQKKLFASKIWDTGK